MSITLPMTIGQMKQVIRRLDGAVPTNLTYGEAKFFAQSTQIGEELAVFWFRIRNMPERRMTIYPVYVDGLITDTMDNHHIKLARDWGRDKEALRKLASTFPRGKPRLEALEIYVISGNFDSAEEIENKMQEDGYVSASFDELIAFAAQHGDHFARTVCEYVHILKQTDEGTFPMVWADNGQTEYAHLQLSFDDLREGLLNQISASSVAILVKRP